MSSNSCGGAAIVMRANAQHARLSLLFVRFESSLPFKFFERELFLKRSEPLGSNSTKHRRSSKIGFGNTFSRVSAPPSSVDCTASLLCTTGFVLQYSMAFKAQASKYRHVTGKIVKKELWYPDLRINASASDVTMVEGSTKYIAVNWSSPTATLGILPVEQVGKRKGDPFLINAHSGQLADFKFSPFDDGLLATGSINDDAVVNLWKIPEGGLTENLSTPFASLSGHRRSVDTFAFHPSAANVLAR